MKAMWLFFHTQLVIHTPNTRHYWKLSHSLSLSPPVPDDAPSITLANATSFSTVFLMWQPPTIPNGDITHYTIATRSRKHSQTLSLNGSEMSYVIEGLMAFTNYNISLSANTSAGEGPADSIQVQTLENGKDISLKCLISCSLSLSLCVCVCVCAIVKC